MKNPIVLPVLVVLLGFGAGCVREAAPTVEYYRSHIDERRAQLQKCTDNPGSLGKTTSCINAREAERMESIGSVSKLPSMGLGDQKPAPAGEEAGTTR